MKDLNKYILEKAQSLNVCAPGALGITNAASVNSLLDMYVKDIDFCLDNNFPSNTDLEQLGGDLINEYGIYINSRKRLTDRPFLVLLGGCIIDASYGRYQVGQLFVKHTSSAHVYAKDRSFIVVDCFDDSTTSVEVHDNAKVLVNVYGNAKVTQRATGSARIKIVNKLKRTY